MDVGEYLNKNVLVRGSFSPAQNRMGNKRKRRPIRLHFLVFPPSPESVPVYLERCKNWEAMIQ